MLTAAFEIESESDGLAENQKFEASSERTSARDGHLTERTSDRTEDRRRNKDLLSVALLQEGKERVDRVDDSVQVRAEVVVEVVLRAVRRPRVNQR